MIRWCFILPHWQTLSPPCRILKNIFMQMLMELSLFWKLAGSNGVKKLTYVASSSCYGLASTLPTPEDASIEPMYPYALTKNIGEQMVIHWSNLYDIPAISLRFFNIFGPRSRTSGTYSAVFGVFLAQLLAKKPLTIVGDGSQKRDFTYVTDAVSALIAASESSISGECMNVWAVIGQYQLMNWCGCWVRPRQ